MKWPFLLFLLRLDCQNLTELMMDMTNGVGCGENEHFSRYKRDVFCCQDESVIRRELEGASDYSKVRRLAPNVCSYGPKKTDKGAPTPRCICNEGLDLKFSEVGTTPLKHRYN